MDVNRLVVFALALVPVLATAQVTSQTRRTIRAYGEGEVSVRPDQARIQISIVTRAATADQASQENATRSTTVFEEVKKLIGNAGEIQTSYYTVNAYSEGNPPKQTGFQVTNSIRVTVNNLNITGRVIDAAIAAGANRVDSLTLGLRDDDPVRLEALRAAGQRAKQRAEAIATGLGVRVGQVISADEGYSARPLTTEDSRALAAASTPIEAGSMTVRATVTVEYEIVP
jgi:uncharacterized protein YggE